MQRVSEQIKSSGVLSFTQLNYTLPSSQADLGTENQMSNSPKVFTFNGQVWDNFGVIFCSAGHFSVRPLVSSITVTLFQCLFQSFSLSLSDPEPQKPAGVEEKLRRPFFSASLSLPSPRSNPSRRRPIKHDSWVGHVTSVREWWY